MLQRKPGTMLKHFIQRLELEGAFLSEGAFTNWCGFKPMLPKISSSPESDKTRKRVKKQERFQILFQFHSFRNLKTMQQCFPLASC